MSTLAVSTKLLTGRERKKRKTTFFQPLSDVLQTQDAKVSFTAKDSLEGSPRSQAAGAVMEANPLV